MDLSALYLCFTKFWRMHLAGRSILPKIKQIYSHHNNEICTSSDAAERKTFRSAYKVSP